MGDEQDIKQLELLCTQLYEAGDPTVRAEAEKALFEFQNGPDALSKCQILLERSNSSYAQLLACTTLTKLVSRSSQILPLQQRVQIRNYILNYMATRSKLPNFVLQSLVSLFAKITKSGWFDGEKEDFYVFRNVVHDVSHFLQGSVEHCIIGVQILSQLTIEMNQMTETDGNRSLTKNRKTASSFRDCQLFEIFRLACSLLTSANENYKTMNFDDAGQHGLASQCLNLALNCLTFDFIGTATDESSDDLCTVQIPTSWRPAFLEMTTLKLFFDLYHSLPNSLSHMALSCLVQLASVRRSLFGNAERGKFLNHLTAGVKHILQNPQDLRDPNNYHEFCRLLARLKSNYQLGELVMVDNYPELISLIAKFTVESLQVWQFAPNSVHYLLSLWQRMVASVPYVKAAEPHLLDTYTPEVTSAYISARLDAVPVIIRDGLEDPLDDLGMILQQLEQVSVIARCDYQKTCALLVQIFDQSASLYQELLNSPTALPMDITIQEARLTWLVYIIGSAIGGRIQFGTNDEHDVMDGELVVRVLQLMNLTDSRLPQCGSEKLELAFLNFFEQFRKIYIGEQVPKAANVYKRLHEVLGIGEEQLVLSVLIRKIITNLKYWSRSETTISRTLGLLNDLSVGYTCVRKLVKLEEIVFILNNHTSEHFPFLGNTVSLTEMRLRSTFYTSLGRLLMVDLGEEEDKFETFMAPLANILETVGNFLSSSDPNVFANATEMKALLIGLARDLRGIAFAFCTKPSFMMFFDWIYPKYLPVFVQAIDLWPAEPQVTTPVLKLFTEMVQNRSQRLQFDVSSPCGILLFREASKIICTYAKHILPLEPTKEQLYPLKLKGISICFSMLKAALCGGYVNFGVFRLYNDDTLDNVLNTFVKLLLCVPRNGLLDYPKLSQTYYVLLDCLAQDHMTFLSTLEPQVFLYVLSTISDGLNPATDTMICTGCCTTLDHIISYLFKRVHIKEKKIRQGLSVPNDPFLDILESRADIFHQLLNTLLNIIMFDDCRNQWSMSRPLLGLILLNEQYFNQLRENIIRNQPPEKQNAMAIFFDNLMEGVERNLLVRNRDRFTQNISSFKKEIAEKSTSNSMGSAVNVASTDNMITT